MGTIRPVSRREVAFEGDRTGGWAELPAALARLQLELPVGTPIRCLLSEPPAALPPPGPPGRPAARPGPGARPPAPPPGELAAGAGFGVERAWRAGGGWVINAVRERTLPDFVAPGMRLLVCGLNPSLVAADAGFGYAGATNRFWAAAVAAGLVTRPRQPLESLAVDRVGMTDLVKRATPNADGVLVVEYRAGAERVQRLVEWLRPGVVLFVGLAGWRAAVDRRARPGPQPSPFGGAPAYVMPSTSGRNARTSPAELAGHVRRALALSTLA